MLLWFVELRFDELALHRLSQPRTESGPVARILSILPARDGLSSSMSCCLHHSWIDGTTSTSASSRAAYERQNVFHVLLRGDSARSCHRLDSAPRSYSLRQTGVQVKLTLDQFEAHFREYREHLQREVGRFRDAAFVYRQISERTKDYLGELNLAPAFFHTVQDSLFTTIILWADKLFDAEGERGLFNFLSFIEYNRDWMTLQELQRRKNYPDGHWMLRPENRGQPISFESIEEDRQRIRGLAALKSIQLRRNKFQSHFDKEYFFDRQKLQREAPITWESLAEAGEVMVTMLNNYSADFDGGLFAAETLGIDDLTRLLDAARRGRGK